MIIRPTLQQIADARRGPLADAGAMPWDPLRAQPVATATWTPADYGSALIAWYRDTYAAGTWSDLSGNGRNVTQGTAAARPAQVTRAGQLALSFDGGDYMSAAFGSSFAQPNTILAVVEPNSPSAGAVVCDGDDGSNRHALYIPSGWGMVAGAVLTGGSAPTNAIHGVAAVYNGMSSALYVDNFGPAVFSGNAGSHALDGLFVGANFAAGALFTGYVWELVIVDGSLSAGDRALFAAYASARYAGLTITT